jgi:Tfp pilus assembly protein PilX
MKSLPPSCHRAGAALVTTLAIVTVLAALLLSYLVTAQLDRQSTFNYSQSLKAEELALGALQEITSGLRQEIDAGSDPAAKYTVSGVRLYQPVTNRTLLPARLGFPATDFATDIDPTGVKLPPTLLQVSRSGAAYPADYDPARTPSLVASASSSTNASANGRHISPARWNKPLFLGDTDPAQAGNQPAQPFAARPPDWIYLTRAGSRVCTDAETAGGDLKADPAGTRPHAVVGRYAYVIYDEGALLDINVAGFPQSASTADAGAVAGKSFVSYADLTVLPGLSPALIDELAAWRHKGGLALDPLYSTVVSKAAAKGFLQARMNDNPLLSRQDLIDYLTRNQAQAAIPFLTTFSRAANAPSASPAMPPAGSIAYAAEADTAGKANRNLANLRAPAALTLTHYDDAGVASSTTLQPGQPLLQRRFSLAKLAWLTPTGNAAGIPNQAIRACFGLEWDSAHKRWTYRETASPMPSPQAIKTLDVVASEHREPNFFELLKACILRGSLGKDPGAVSTSTAATFVNDGVMGYGFEISSSVPDAQIFRIGASIIDQADADGFPTAVFCPIFTGLNPPEVVNTFVGTENLPYLHRLHQIVLATQPGSKTAGTNGKLAAWLQPEIWNPHQIPASTSGSRPTRFRIRTYGMAMTTWWQWLSAGGMSGSVAGGTNLMDYEGTEFSKGVIYFDDAGGSASPYVNHPVALTTGLVDASQTDPDCLFDDPPGEYPHLTGTARSNAFAAIYSGESSVAFTPKTEASPYTIWARTLPVAEISVVLEYEASGSGDWRPYSQMSRIRASVSANFSANVSPETAIVGATPPKLFFNHVDARTDRFSASGDWPNGANNTFAPDKTIWESSASGGLHSVSWFAPRPASGFSYTAGTQLYLGDWQINTASSRARYADADGVIRPADGFRGNDATGDGRPTFHGGVNAPRRPVILDRPFRSVGELGYVFRDEPFKSLDFWSEESGDAALLDAFSVVDQPRVVAGLLHLNNTPETILKAVLAGAGKNASDPGVQLGSEAETLAASLAADLGTRPVSNRADLAARLGVVVQGVLTNPQDKANKTYAETPLRALAEVTDTRTWNLLIDVIAQSGRMSPSATTLDHFLVEGEKRYWLHLALDRFTGEIIDQQLEPVYE